jgi:hypothetical protein
LYREIFGLDRERGGAEDDDAASGPTHAISGGKDD